MGKYLIFNPGEYHDFEKDQVERRFAMAQGDGGPAQMPHGGPMGPMEPRPFTEEEILAFNRKWNPYDPLYTDPAYARSQGFSSVPAMPGFVKPRGRAVMGFPKDIADCFYYTNDGGNFEIRKHIFAGDLLKPGKSEADFSDVTSPGADIRIWRIGGYGESVDQNGEVTLAGYSNTRDAYRKIIDGSSAPTFSENMSEWCDYFPSPHYTTDEDWDYIRELWSKETIRGENTFYWEDAEIGYEVPKTCSGPITYMNMIEWYGARGLSREQLCDKHSLKTMFRDPYGNYIFETGIHLGTRNLPNGRMVWYNNTGANHVYRTVTNFIGNKGRVSLYSWRFLPFFKELRSGSIAAEMFNKVKGMEGRDCDRHGSEGDCCIGRAVITDKYINERGEHCIEVAAWGETLDGDIVQACPSEVVLPDRG